MFISSEKKKDCLRAYDYYYYNNFVCYYHSSDIIRCDSIASENNIYRKQGIFMTPLDFDIGFSCESHRARREFNSNDAKLGRKSKLTPAAVTYLRLYTIYYTYGVYFSRLNVQFFFLHLKSSACYYMHRRRLHLFILTVV